MDLAKRKAALSMEGTDLLCSSSMAEFVSAIVALVAAGAKAGDSLYTLIDTIKDAPSEFLDLSNEVSDFRLIISKIIEAQEFEDLTTNKGSKDELSTILERGKGILEEVAGLVQEVSKQQENSRELAQVNRFRWLRRVKKAKKLQCRLQRQKLSLCSLAMVKML